jgi:hypothetical protein
MELLKAVSLQCPYCGETIEVLIDCTVPLQEYVEDCKVCCKPITVSARVTDDDTPQVEAQREDE